MYDYLIVGGGPAGLYTAKRLEEKYKQNKNLSILLLEQSSRLGGRTCQEYFHSRLVVTGAGVGRYPKDKILYRLVKSIVPDGNIPVLSQNICFQSPHPVDTMIYINALRSKREWIMKNRSRLTFRQLFLSFFSRAQYRSFCDSNGYTDFQHADMIDTLDDYGFEDNLPGRSYFRVPWNALIRHLKKSLRRTTVVLNTRVSGFTRSGPVLHVATNNGKIYETRNIVFAGSVSNYPYTSVRREIGYNTFLRMYVLFEKNEHVYKDTYYTGDTFQKIIRLSPRIYMLSYSDGTNARRVNAMTKQEIEKRIGRSIVDLHKFFWRVGTHFYKPLNTQLYKDRDEFIIYAQHPEPNVFLVGEVISKNQGWTEGAFESVEKILALL